MFPQVITLLLTTVIPINNVIPNFDPNVVLIITNYRNMMFSYFFFYISTLYVNLEEVIDSRSVKKMIQK